MCAMYLCTFTYIFAVIYLKYRPGMIGKELIIDYLWERHLSDSRVGLGGRLFCFLYFKNFEQCK